jgi:hypothetical protein
VLQLELLIQVLSLEESIKMVSKSLTTNGMIPLLDMALSLKASAVKIDSLEFKIFLNFTLLLIVSYKSNQEMQFKPKLEWNGH